MAAGTASYLIASDSGRPAAQQTSARILLYKDRASPDAIAVKVGETVEFISADGASHSLSLGGGTAGLEGGGIGHEGHGHQHLGDFSSGEFKSDEAWQVVFKKAGTYELHDHLHPGVRISVIAYGEVSPAMIQ